MSQLLLKLTLPELFSADNFFISQCNCDAFKTVMEVKKWQGHALYLVGGKSSGKSHLAHIWQQKNNAIIIQADNINPDLVNESCVVENIELCTNEKLLLHLFNHCKDLGVKLLITSSFTPALLPFKLPDLTSRLRGCQVATIYPPDDDLMGGVLRKQFSDRQLLVDDDVIDYLVARMERTMDGIKSLVEKLDANALAEQKNITIPFVKKNMGY